MGLLVLDYQLDNVSLERRLLDQEDNLGSTSSGNEAHGDDFLARAYFDRIKGQIVLVLPHAHVGSERSDPHFASIVVKLGPEPVDWLNH
jgi:hypothetical protein